MCRTQEYAYLTAANKENSTADQQWPYVQMTEINDFFELSTYQHSYYN